MPKPSAPQPSAPLARGHWMALIAALLGWMFDGFEMGLFPLIGNSALKELLARSSTDLDPAAIKLFTDQWFGVIMAMFLVGAATGGVLFGWLGDRVGRVRALSLSILTYAVFTGLCGFATEAWHIAVLRFIASLGMGGEWALGVALVIEIWPDSSRAVLAGLIGAASNVGFLLVALIKLTLGELVAGVKSSLVAVGLSDALVASLTSNDMWRLLMIVGALPALLVFFIRLFVPESEKWHAEKKRGATSHWATVDLLGVLVGCIGAVGVIVVWSPLMSALESVEIQRMLCALVTPLGLAIALIGYMYPVRKYLARAGAAGALRSMDAPTVLRRMMFGATLTGIALLGTWGTVQWIPKWVGEMKIADATGHEGAYTQMATATGAIISTFLAALIGGWIGRRLTYALICAASIAAVLLLFQVFNEYGTTFLLAALLAGGTTAAMYGFFPLYLPELFPTSVRSTAQGFAFNFGRILAAIGGLQTATMKSFFGDFPTAGSVMSVIYVLGLIVIWLGPETKGKPLPE